MTALQGGVKWAVLSVKMLDFGLLGVVTLQRLIEAYMLTPTMPTNADGKTI